MELSHGGGCGCKIAPSRLEELLRGLPAPFQDENLLVDHAARDDAAVYRINETEAIIATTDFFMPIVNDPYEFGRIAATNAISDVYAMGGRPFLALSLVGMPVNRLSSETIRAILTGGADVCRSAGVSLSGGHSIDSVEPIYGLAVNGIIHPDRIKTNRSARAGDRIVLGKPLGIGILSNLLKKDELEETAYRAMIRHTTQLNTPGIAFGSRDDVHAMTDVTGFGLAGHLLEICRASNVSARLHWNRIPIIAEALAHAKGGSMTGASHRNWQSYGDAVRFSAPVDDWMRNLLTDPQTSGGLLLAVESESADEIVDLFQREGFGDAAIIGEIDEAGDGATVDVIV